MKKALGFLFLASSTLFANAEQLFTCSHQTPYGQRHVRTYVKVFGDLSSENMKYSNWMVTVNQGKESRWTEHLYNWKRTFLEGDAEVTDENFIVQESFGRSYLKISKKKTDDYYKGELVVYAKDGDKDSGKTVSSNVDTFLVESHNRLSYLNCRINKPRVFSLENHKPKYPSAPSSSSKKKFEAIYNRAPASPGSSSARFTLSDFAGTTWKNHERYLLKFDETGTTTTLSFKKNLFTKKKSVVSKGVTIREGSDPQVIVGTYHFLKILDNGNCLLPTGGAEFPGECFRKQ